MKRKGRKIIPKSNLPPGYETTWQSHGPSLTLQRILASFEFFVAIFRYFYEKTSTWKQSNSLNQHSVCTVIHPVSPWKLPFEEQLGFPSLVGLHLVLG